MNDAHGFVALRLDQLDFRLEELALCIKHLEVTGHATFVSHLRNFTGIQQGLDEQFLLLTKLKHFSGGGPQNEGLDPHFEFQKGQIYPGDNFAYHLIPFEAAIAAHTAAIMPYYGVRLDQTDENVAMSFNKAIITGLLHQKYQ